MVKHGKIPFTLFLALTMLIILCKFSVAQLSVIQGSEMGLTPEQLVRNYLVGQGIMISNVTLNGFSSVISTNNIGYFQTAGGALAQLNIPDGIIMTTGRADYAIGPNNKPSAGFKTNTGSDPDLEVIMGSASFDVCVIEFDFIPQCDTLRFRYAFGSEEFYEFCSSSINDAFGFFLSGPGISGFFSRNSTNIARMPGSNAYVTIGNICPDSASAWDNNGGLYYQYDAITYVFTAWYLVQPWQTYHIKLAIGDNQDATYDSGIFLEKGSFTAGVDLRINNYPSSPATGMNAIEGCNDVVVAFTIPQPAPNSFTLQYSVGGTAINGLDYSELPGSITFNAGEDSVGIIIHPFRDGLTEERETVILDFIQQSCSGTQQLSDTIIIESYDEITLSLGDDITICPDDSVTLVASISGGLEPYRYHWNVPSGDDSLIRVSLPSGAQSFIVEVTDQCNISRLDTVEVSVSQTAFVTNSPLAKNICDGDSTRIYLSSNITSAYFSWVPSVVSGNITGFVPGAGNVINQLLTTGSPTPSALNYLITVTGNGCDTSYADFLVTVNPLPEIELGDTLYLDTGSPIILDAGDGFTRYLWSTGDTVSMIQIEGGGLIWIRVQNDYSCMASDSVIILEFGLYIPNAFTPNGDGLNDRFRISDIEPGKQWLLQIFNRWGTLIFQTNDLNTGWDGTCFNQPCPCDTYVWVITLESANSRIFKGTVTIVK